MTPSITACPRCGQEFTRGEVFCPRDGARVVSADSADGMLEADEPRSPAIDPLLGQLLSGRYRVRRKIGEGGMGRVYEVLHELIDKPMALKVLREDFSHRAEVVTRFRQEAKSASRIGHEHIVDIYDFGLTPDGAHYFVMELLHGRDLADELEARGALPTRRALAIALQCARALAAAHDKGIVHRDIKPENVFLLAREEGEDFIKLVDFGIAKFSAGGATARRLTQTGVIFGTPEYMAPEQASGQPLDHRIDVYALGIILFELLTGRVPFVGDTFMGVLTQHAYDDVPSLATFNPCCFAPPEVERVVMRALAKRPDDRYPSMHAFAADLARLLEALAPPRGTELLPGTLAHTSDLPPPPAAPRLPPPTSLPPAPAAADGRLFRWLSSVAAIGLFLLVGTLFFARSHGAAPAHLAREAAPATASSAAPSIAPSADAPVEAPRAAPDEVAEVAIDVVSQPDGASVSVDGHAVCAATPCRFHAQRGALQRLTVKKPGFVPSSIEVTPSADAPPVALVLRRREALPGHRMQGDLMLPDAFGKR